MGQSVAVQDPRSSIQAIMDENEKLKRQLEQALSAQDEMQKETAEFKEAMAELKPYMDIIQNSEGQRYMQVHIRDTALITQLKIKARQIYPGSDTDAESRDVAKISRDQIDKLVETMIWLCINGFWAQTLMQYRKQETGSG